MAHDQGPVVVVGAGHAGGWVALTIREHQPDRPIVLIGEEDHPPYERPPLSKDVLAGRAAPESAYLRPLAHYAEAGVDLRLGTRVVALDRAARTVELSPGGAIPYHTLVLATGMRPRRLAIPGADHPGVRALRAIGDLAPIRDRMEAGGHVVAIGAGFIGLEIAAVATTLGCAVTVLEAAPHALGRVVAAEVAGAIVGRHERRGVRFRFGAKVVRIADRAGAPVVHLADGETLAADLVVVGIGGIPNDDLAGGAGLDCDNGICVDARGLTSDPAIYAAGDVCRQLSLALGRPIRLESWQNAQNQAIAVGREIAGVPEPYADLPWFWTDQYDDNFQIIGAPERWDGLVWRGGPDEDRFTAIYLDGDRVVAGNALNNARDIRPLRQMILDRARVDRRLLADTGTSLVKIQKLQAVR